MREPWEDISEALNNALFIGRYVKKHNKHYKKDKKIINEMIDDLHNMNFSKYLEDEDDDLLGG